MLYDETHSLIKSLYVFRTYDDIVYFIISLHRTIELSNRLAFSSITLEFNNSLKNSTTTKNGSQLNYLKILFKKDPLKDLRILLGSFLGFSTYKCMF